VIGGDESGRVGCGDLPKQGGTRNLPFSVTAPFRLHTADEQHDPWSSWCTLLCDPDQWRNKETGCVVLLEKEEDCMGRLSRIQGVKALFSNNRRSHCRRGTSLVCVLRKLLLHYWFGCLKITFFEKGKGPQPCLRLANLYSWTEISSGCQVNLQKFSVERFPHVHHDQLWFSTSQISQHSLKICSLKSSLTTIHNTSWPVRLILFQRFMHSMINTIHRLGNVWWQESRTTCT
jgi:hypothetical protein